MQSSLTKTSHASKPRQDHNASAAKSGSYFARVPNLCPETEACDDGAGNSDTAPDACRTNCTNPTCGDGVVDSGEQCDDAGESATCDVDCTVAVCGDGTINISAGEACDDAGQSPTCNLDCTVVVMPSFQGLGGNSVALAVSADGTVVVGTAFISSRVEAFRWTSDSGIVGLGFLPNGFFSSEAVGTSGDGALVVGSSVVSTNFFEAFLWTSGAGMAGLGSLPGGNFSSEANGISADGSIVVGKSSSASGIQAFRWMSVGEMVGLGFLPGGTFSTAKAISTDGLVIVGDASSALGVEAFRWTSGGGMVGLGDLPGGSFFSEALAVSANGGVVVGQGNSASGKEACRWTSNGGMIGLGDLPGGIFESYAFATSADGAIVVGRGSPASSFAAFLWTANDGMRLLRDILVTDLGLDLTGWQLKEARAISPDGTIIVGRGINPAGNAEAWIATVPPAPVCGDGILEGTEQCDDAGQSPTCDIDCTVALCGDGTVNGSAGEECDDSGTAAGDGCSATCTVESGSSCTGEPSVCITRIPAVSEWGLVAMALLVVTTGTLVCRRHRPAQA